MASSKLTGNASENFTPVLGQPRLINNNVSDTRNICYVNSIVQMISNTGIRDFMKKELPDILITARPEDYPTARALFSLYKEGGEVKSAAQLRRYTGLHTLHRINSSHDCCKIEILCTPLSLVRKGGGSYVPV